LRHPLKVWRDPGDRISVLRIVTLMCLFAPLSKAIYDSDAIRLDARPITELIHRTGDWALIFLLVALAVRPLSRILRFNQLLDVRRMIGIGAFAYAAAHFTLYIVDLMFDWREIASEIVHRNRLTLGFVALLGLTVLALTSTNGMVRRLGIRRIVQIAAGDHRIEDRRLNVDAPGRGNLRDDLDAEVFCGRLNPDLHDLVEWIHDPRQETDLDFRGGVGGMRRQGQSQSSCDCK